MGLLWLLVGFVGGAAVVWLWVKRRVDEDTARLEASYEGRLRHLQEEVGRADQAHEETKQLVRALQAEKVAIEARVEQAAGETTRLRSELDAAKAAMREIEARLEAAKAARRPATPAAAAPAPAAPPDERERRLKAIDAKLRMLPAGSSARAALMAERQRLAGDGPAATPPAAPPDAVDDLEVVKGIGPKIHEELGRMGIVSLAQLAALTPPQIARIEERIGFPGRIERERWVAQAKALLARRA